MKSKHYQNLTAQVKLAKDVFIASNATVIGDVILEEGVTVWYNAVIRADFQASIHIGERTNVQDGVIMHVDPHMPIKIGSGCIIGHGAIVHGATIGNNTLIGMRATVMNGAKIGDNCVIGAHALVTEGMEIPDNSVVIGVPAKIVRSTPIHFQQIRQMGVEEYHKEGLKYLNNG